MHSEDQSSGMQQAGVAQSAGQVNQGPDEAALRIREVMALESIAKTLYTIANRPNSAGL